MGEDTKKKKEHRGDEKKTWMKKKRKKERRKTRQKQGKKNQRKSQRTPASPSSSEHKNSRQTKIERLEHRQKKWDRGWTSIKTRGQNTKKKTIKEREENLGNKHTKRTREQPRRTNQNNRTIVPLFLLKETEEQVRTREDRDERERKNTRKKD